MLISAVLGFNCWLTGVALPAWHLARLGTLGLWVLVASASGLLALTLGVVLLSRRRRESAPLLILVFPVLAMIPAVIQPTLVRASVLSPPAVAVAGLSFATYLIGVCWATAVTRTEEVLVSEVPLEEHTPRRVKALPSLLLTVAAVTSVVVIATAHLQPFGPREEQVRVLSAAAMVLWVSALFGVIAPALRHRNPWPLTRASRGAAAVWLLVVVLGAVMLALAMTE